MIQFVVRPRVVLMRAWYALWALVPGELIFMSDPGALHAFCHLWTEVWALSRSCAVVRTPDEVR